MGVETTRYIRKPLYVDAVRVTAENFEEVAAWCDGKIERGAPNPNAPDKKKKCIKVNVLSPKHIRQTMAFVGDWVLKQGDNFKIYTYKAFKMAFDEAPEETTEPNPRIPRLQTETGSDQKIKHEPVADLPPQPRRVGANVEIRDDRPKEQPSPVEAEESAQAEEDIKLVPQAQPSSDLMDPPPPGGDMFPPDDVPMPDAPEPIESPEMKEAREMIEADGGTVEPATPEAIAEVVEETKTVDEIIESHPDGPITGMSEAAGETPIAPEAELDDVAKGDPIPEKPPEHAAAGKRVLSEHEQRILGPDEVRAMVRSGDVILAQDLEPAEQS